MLRITFLLLGIC